MLSRENDHLSVLAPADTVECILEGYHDEHLAQIMEGDYISWKTDHDCGCPPEDGYCGCIIYQILDETRANEILKNKPT